MVSTAPLASISILHIEDSMQDAVLVRTYLAKAKINTSKQLHHVDNMEDALLYLEKNTANIILLDLCLPDSTGLETLSRLKAFSPNYSIVVISGSSDEETALEAVKKGAQDYLIKDELNSRSIVRAIRYSMERHTYDQKIIELANIDLLTRLPNRARFLDYIEHSIESTHRLTHSVSLLFIDCDSFKLINDTYGHLKGDEYLIKFANKLKSAVRSTDFIARLSGDEFVILISHRDSRPQEAITVAEKTLKSFDEDIVLSSSESIQARCSIGITSYHGKYPRPSSGKLIQEADAAMYVSKKRGGHCYSFFDSELEKMAERRAVLLRSLANAVKTQSFTLAYQPIIETKTQKTIGLEALLRWKNEKGEVIPPYQFIPLLEESGLIKALGYWVIHEACTQFMQLKSTGALPPQAWISLNISPVQLLQIDFAQQLISILTELSISPEAVHLEITESVLVDQGSLTKTILSKVKDFGCKWVIDDFGIGYSSMNYLRNLPVSILKIDQTFVRNCLEGRKDLGITKAIIALAHNLDMSVVAEGVETVDIANLLTDEGCEFIQGYFYAKPMPIEALKKHLNEQFPKKKRVVNA